MPPETQNSQPDQVDIVAQNERLTAELTAAHGSITDLRGQVQSLTEKNLAQANDLVAAQSSITALTSERDSLRSDNERLQGDMKDFNARVAAEIAKHGIRPTAVDNKPEKERVLTMTDKCLAAKGKA